MMIRHGEWFYREYQGAEFRAFYYDYGFTFAKLQVEMKVFRKFRKWIFFGPYFVWKKVLSEKEIAPLFIQIKKTFYDKIISYRLLLICLDFYLSKLPVVEIEIPEEEEELQEIF